MRSAACVLAGITWLSAVTLAGCGPDFIGEAIMSWIEAQAVAAAGQLDIDAGEYDIELKLQSAGHK